MKFTIMGFSQKEAVKFGLDSLDLTILRWFVDFKDSGKMIARRLKGENYYWISYKAIVDDLPILYIKKAAVYKRLLKMCNAGILKKRIVCEFGKYSFYTLDKNYINLISSGSKTSPKHNKNVFGCDENLDLNHVHDLTLARTDFNSDDCDDVDLDSSEIDLNIENIEPQLDNVKCDLDTDDFCDDSVDSNSNLSDQNSNHFDLNFKQNINLLNKSIKSERCARDENSSEALANLLLSLIQKNNPNFKTPNIKTMKNWVKTFDAILNFDHRDPKEVADLIKWIHTESEFWGCQILNPSNLRNQYDRIICRKNYEEHKFVTQNHKQKAFKNSNEPKQDCIVINSIYGPYKLVGFEDV